MKLNTRSRYAVMAMVDLARHGLNKQVPLKDLATRQAISPLYLEQLFVPLRREGLVRSYRGTQGGYQLSRAPGTISVAAIVAAMGDPIRITRCAGKGKAGTGCLSHGAICATHRLWRGLEKHIWSYLENISLASLVSDNATDLGTDIFLDRCTTTTLSRIPPTDLFES